MKEDVVVLDLRSMPDGFDAEKWLYLMKTHGVCMVDSMKGGQMPYVLGERKKLTFMVKDINNEKETKS